LNKDSETNDILSQLMMKTRKLDSLKMTQNISVIWLNNNMNDDGVDYQHMTAQLSNYVNMINRFNDIDQCMNFIKKSPANGNGCVTICENREQSIIISF